MKKIILLLFFLTQSVWAEQCIVKSAAQESDGNLDAQTIVVCDSRGVPKKNVKVGDLVLEPEMGRGPVAKYFTYNNARCRMFMDRLAISGELKVYHGVICQVENSHEDWIVISKWRG